VASADSASAWKNEGTQGFNILVFAIVGDGSASFRFNISSDLKCTGKVSGAQMEAENANRHRHDIQRGGDNRGVQSKKKLRAKPSQNRASKTVNH